MKQFAQPLAEAEIVREPRRRRSPVRARRASTTAPRRPRQPSARKAWPELRNGTLSLVDQAVVSAASFATSVTIGRLRSKQELGIFYLAITIVYLAKAIQETVIFAPYTVYCQARRDEARALYAGSVLLHYLALSVVALGALAGILGLLALGIGPIELSPVVWVLLGALPFLQLREFIRRLAIAHLRMEVAIAIDLIVGLLQVGSLLVLAYFERLTVTRAYAVMGAACGVVCCAWFVGARRSLRFNWSGAVADWWHNWRFARWALASHAIGFATLYLTPWLVTAVRGSGEAGVLAACISVVGIASMFLTGLQAFLTPRAAIAFSQGGTEELRRMLRIATTIYGTVLGAFALCVFAWGDLLLVLAFGNKYSGYGPVLGVLALCTLALSLGLTAGIGLWAIDHPKANLFPDACTLAVTLILMICLLPSLGVMGAALGDLAGKTVGASLRHIVLRRRLASGAHSFATS